MFGNAATSPARTFRAGGYVGEWLAALLSDYFNRTGSIIVILTLMFLAVIIVDAVLVRPAVRGDRGHGARTARRRGVGAFRELARRATARTGSGAR